MNEPTPPPERPLPDGARARIRADLLGHAHEDRSTAPRWLVPAGAAAAVALVAGLAYWAISPGGSTPDGAPLMGSGDASSVPSSPTVQPSSVPSTEGTWGPTPPTGPGTVQVGTGSCQDELENVLGGATLAVQVDDTSSFWVKGQKFVLCDELDGRTTVHKALPLVPADNVSTFAVSTDLLKGQVIQSAGGIVPSGAEDVVDVAYTFPDGHTEHATTSTDDQGRTWWHMLYAYDDPGGNTFKQPGIKVTWSLSGAQAHFTLTWATDTCAQANHGC